MRHFKLMLCIGGLVLLGACGQTGKNADVERAMKGVNVIDETNLNDIMLTVADPNEAVDYFRRASQQDPSRIDFQRGLGKSLIRAKRATEAAAVWKKVVAHKDTIPEDREDYAEALIRNGEWEEAKPIGNFFEVHEAQSGV